MTRWGLIARSETDRGIGIQTLALFEHLHPERTLVVVDKKSGFRPHPSNYPDATVTVLKHGNLKNSLDETVVRDWWAGLDVVFTVETFYDWDLIGWAKDDGVATIVQGNPEFWVADNPQPDVWTWPTSWRTEFLPTGPIIPVPTLERPNVAAHINVPNLKALHIAGNRAMGDRNGTDLVALAMRRVPTGTKMTMYSQAPVAPIRGLSYRQPVENRWEMYHDSHVLVLPRRYGGLCLPALEAMACGLAVLMPNCSPNTDWPIYELNGDIGRTLRMQTGPVQTFDTFVNDIANALKTLNARRDLLEASMLRAREWAEANTWDTHAETYYKLIEDASRSSR